MFVVIKKNKLKKNEKKAFNVFDEAFQNVSPTFRRKKTAFLFDYTLF